MEKSRCAKWSKTIITAGNCERLLQEEKVAAVPGNAFGSNGEGFIRCCYAASVKDLEEAIIRMGNFLNRHR